MRKKNGGVDNLIPLTKGKFAIVDKEDYEKVNQFKWHFQSGYAARTYKDEDGKAKSIYMHQFILNYFVSRHIDHINRNGLDNRKKNLRKIIEWQNAFNRERKTKSKTGYRGVRLLKNGMYIAQFQFRYRCIYLGTFKTAREAAKAYNNAIEIYVGKIGIKNKL